ncbi:uncharacterized protein LOC124893166 [Capsicum annuum]|uniref:uncharacterized protein LOC124893166 n=1 Tax=Capsicum annuum TaxID=4072 RepID=UPI001FB195B7|nr:uncharacterized protein LOC124893166 [Capsicum annuum]
MTILHIASNCGKKFCNYCKQHGHIIKDCPTCPQNHRINAFQAEMNGSTFDNSYSTGTNNQFATPAIGRVLTTELVQQMIVSALSALAKGSSVGEDNREWA